MLAERGKQYCLAFNGFDDLGGRVQNMLYETTNTIGNWDLMNATIGTNLPYSDNSWNPSSGHGVKYTGNEHIGMGPTNNGAQLIFDTVSTIQAGNVVGTTLSVSGLLSALGNMTNAGWMVVGGAETNYGTFVDIGNSLFTGTQSVGTEIDTNLDVQNPNGGVVGSVLTMTSSTTGAAAWSNSIAVSGSITAGTTISAPNLATNGTPNTVGGLITMPTNGNCFESTNNLAGMTNLTTLDSMYIPMGAGITSNIVSGNITAATPVDITNNGDGWSFLNGVSNAFYVRLAMPVGWNLGTIQVMTRAYTQITNGIGTLATNAVFYSPLARSTITRWKRT